MPLFGGAALIYRQARIRGRAPPQVSDRQHADQPAALDDGETSYRTLTHPHRGPAMSSAGATGGALRTANVAELHLGWLAPIRNRAHHDVAIGDDPQI